MSYVPGWEAGLPAGQRVVGRLTACGPRVASAHRSASPLPELRLRTAARALAASAAIASFFSTRDLLDRW